MGERGRDRERNKEREKKKKEKKMGRESARFLPEMPTLIVQQQVEMDGIVVKEMVYFLNT